jgi:hypothetical protein
MKANMIIVRGLKGREVVGEDWFEVEQRVYRMLPPREILDRMHGVFTVIALIPGQPLRKCDGIMYRGCNCIAVMPYVSEVL